MSPACKGLTYSYSNDKKYAHAQILHNIMFCGLSFEITCVEDKSIATCANVICLLLLFEKIKTDKASSHIDENDTTLSCAYWRIGLQPDSLSFVNVLFKSLVVFAIMWLYSFVIVTISVQLVILSMFKNL